MMNNNNTINTKKGGMTSRLEELARQLDEVEHSANALQRDLAFSNKVNVRLLFIAYVVYVA